jgi:hypothetical protein
MHEQDCATNVHYESSAESTTTTTVSKPELNKQFSNDVQSFVQKKNIAQGKITENLIITYSITALHISQFPFAHSRKIDSTKNVERDDCW